MPLMKNASAPREWRLPGGSCHRFAALLVLGASVACGSEGALGDASEDGSTDAESDALPSEPDGGSEAETIVATDGGPSEDSSLPSDSDSEIDDVDSGTDEAGPETDPTEDASLRPSDAGTSPPEAGSPPLNTCGIEVRGTSEMYRPPIRPFWRDDFGLHRVARLRSSTDRLVLDTFAPDTGDLIRRHTYSVLDNDPRATLEGVAHSPGGTVLVYFTLDAEVRRAEYLLLTSLNDPSEYEVLQLPWDQGMLPDTRGLAWDGNAFVWHGLVVLEGENLLATARFAEDGSEVLPLTVVGSPATPIWDNYDMVTDPRSGTTWMTAPGASAARVTGTARDGSPLVPADSPLPILGDIGSDWPSSYAQVSMGAEGQAMFTFHLADDGFVGQLGNAALEPLGNPIRIRTERSGDRNFWFSQNASAYYRGSWWFFVNNGLAVTAYRAEAESIVDSFEIIHFPAREIYAETGKYPTLMRMDLMSTFVYDDELWLGVLDESSVELGGLRERYRMLRVEPGCTYPSQYDRVLAGMED